MPERVAFIDTGYMQAMLNRKDPWRKKAAAIDIDSYNRYFTSEFVLTELLAVFSRGSQKRTAAVEYIEYLKTQPSVEIEPASPHLFERAFDLYKSRSDKPWSLTDCSSFVIMSDNGIMDALAKDDDFRQAGFNPLMR
jgi:uncharacterized protein